MQEILRDAFKRRYGVVAFNIVNDLTLRAVLDAAENTRSPVIIQVSVKTVRQLGARVIRAMFAEMAGRIAVPTALHLDHCPDRDLIAECVAAGWNSVLFDASHLSYEENLAQTTAIVRLAHHCGVAVEGELESVPGVEDGVGSEHGSREVPLDLALRFVRATGIDSFAPAIGTAHGVYREAPRINFQRVAEIVAAEPIPIVLHGGTGLGVDVVLELIRLGAVKVNISTALKIAYTAALKAHLDEHPGRHDPAALHAAAGQAVRELAEGCMRQFGGAGRGV